MQIISGKSATSFGAHLLIHSFHTYLWASLVAQLVKNWLAVQEAWVQSLGWEDPLEPCDQECATISGCQQTCQPGKTRPSPVFTASDIPAVAV